MAVVALPLDTDIEIISEGRYFAPKGCTMTIDEAYARNMVAAGVARYPQKPEPPKGKPTRKKSDGT